MILLPDDKQWNVASWVTRGLLDDLSRQVDRPSPLAEKIQWCLDAEFYTLDLEDASRELLDQLARLVDAAISDTERRGAASFQQPEMYPVYLDKLRALRELLAAPARPVRAGLDATYLFDYGSENAPDAPHGLYRLQIQANGRFRYHNRQRGQLLVERTGRIDEAMVGEIAADLAASGFPQVPDHSLPPGADYLTISRGETSAYMNAGEARRFPGYGPLVARLVPWMQWLRTAEGSPPPGVRLDPAKKG